MKKQELNVKVEVEGEDLKYRSKCDYCELWLLFCEKEKVTNIII